MLRRATESALMKQRKATVAGFELKHAASRKRPPLQGTKSWRRLCNEPPHRVLAARLPWQD